MNKSEAYKQWRLMTANAQKIERDPTIPLWQKAYKIAGAYRGLELGELRSKHRHRVLNILGQMNKILTPYQFESFDEYHRISEAEIEQLILLVKQLEHH